MRSSCMGGGDSLSCGTGTMQSSETSPILCHRGSHGRQFHWDGHYRYNLRSTSYFMQRLEDPVSSGHEPVTGFPCSYRASMTRFLAELVQFSPGSLREYYVTEAHKSDTIVMGTVMGTGSGSPLSSSPFMRGAFRARSLLCLHSLLGVRRRAAGVGVGARSPSRRDPAPGPRGREGRAC